MRLRGTAAMLALAATLLVGCGDDEPASSRDDAPWRTSREPVETTGLAWASNSTVHLSDAVMRLFDLASGEETTSEDGMDTSGVDDPVDPSSRWRSRSSASTTTPSGPG